MNMRMYFKLLNLHFWIVWKLKFFVLLADLVPLLPHPEFSQSERMLEAAAVQGAFA